MADVAEVLEGPGVVFAGVVAGEVGGRDVCDCFGVDAYQLARALVDVLLHEG